MKLKNGIAISANARENLGDDGLFYKILLTKIFYKGNNNLSVFYPNFIGKDGKFSNDEFEKFINKIIKNLINKGSISGIPINSGKEEDFDNNLDSFNDNEYASFTTQLGDLLYYSDSVKKGNLEEDEELEIKIGISGFYSLIPVRNKVINQIKGRVGILIY